MKLPVNYNNMHFSVRKKVREEYVKVQGGLCQCCDKPLDGPACEDILKNSVNKSLFPKGFFNWPVHLHHDHDTGMTIGAVHNYCNAYLWQYKGE